MLISLYYISCHQLRVYKDHFIINHDVFGKVYKVYIYLRLLSNFLKFLKFFLKPFSEYVIQTLHTFKQRS